MVDDADPEGTVKTIFVVELDDAIGVTVTPPTVNVADETFAGNPTPAMVTGVPPFGLTATEVVEMVMGYVTVKPDATAP